VSDTFVIDDGVGGPWDRRPGHYTPFEIQLMNDRFSDLKQAYLDFRDARLRDKTRKWHFFLNDETLVIICGLFINDIKEFKLLHSANIGTDNLKRSAYLARLITKLRPIEFDRKSTDESPLEVNNPKMTFLNEDFAIYVFFLYLQGFRDEWFETKTASQIVAHLRNALRRRDADRDLLVTLAYTTQIAFAGKQPT
jgi:hypothetical protein